MSLKFTSAKYGNHDYQTIRVSTVKMLRVSIHSTIFSVPVSLHSNKVQHYITIRYGGRGSLSGRWIITGSAVVLMVRWVPPFAESGYYYRLVYCIFPTFRIRWRLFDNIRRNRTYQSILKLPPIYTRVHSFNNNINLLERVKQSIKILN